MHELLIQNIAKKNIHLTDDEIAILETAFRYRKFRKNQYILQEGDVSRSSSFILTGLVRVYLVDDKGQEHVLYFMKEDYWVGDLNSNYSETPSQYNIDCLEETEVLQITKADIERICEEVPKMNIFFRHLYRASIIAHEKRTASVLMKSALERYLDFVASNPELERRIPNLHIASYLGITPQSLSRLRGQKMVK